MAPLKARSVASRKDQAKDIFRFAGGFVCALLLTLPAGLFLGQHFKAHPHLQDPLGGAPGKLGGFVEGSAAIPGAPSTPGAAAAGGAAGPSLLGGGAAAGPMAPASPAEALGHVLLAPQPAAVAASSAFSRLARVAKKAAAKAAATGVARGEGGGGGSGGRKKRSGRTLAPGSAGAGSGLTLEDLLAAKRLDGLNASAVGFGWGLLPCAADQACPRPPTFGPVALQAAHVEPPLNGNEFRARAAAVSRFVMDMSLDVLRVGGTGEARLRARRHSAFGPGGLDGAATSGRCSALIKPSTTDQLKGVMQAIEPTLPSAKGGAQAARKFAAFTITDATYGDMLNDVWAGVHRLGMEASFFFVALDKPTALAACHHHMPVLYFKEPLSLPDSKGLPPRSSKFTSTKDRVYEAKYGLAIAMAREATDFLFFEMDCWMLAHPLRAVDTHPIHADLYMSLHQDNPFEFNVGYYYVRASDPQTSDRVERFFTATLAYLRAHDDAFDQKLINCLMKSYASQQDRSYQGLHSRAGCKGQKIIPDLSDPTLKPLTDVAKPNTGLGQGGKNRVMSWALFEIDDVLSSATPLMARDTATVHVLTNVPLTAAVGKKVVAKELMVWEGAYCYYCVGSALAGKHGHVGLHGPQGSVVGEGAAASEVAAMDAAEVDRLSPLAALLDDEQEEKAVGAAATSLRGGGGGAAVGAGKGSVHAARGGGADLEALEATAHPADRTSDAAARKVHASLATAPRRRYLAYDGPLVAADLHAPEGEGPDSWQEANHVEVLAAALLQLVALAVFTGRTLVMPVVAHDGRFVRAWEMLDHISAEQFVEWRETSFLRNPRLLVSEDATMCRASLGASSASLELWRWAATDAPVRPARAYAYPSQGSRWANGDSGGGGGEASPPDNDASGAADEQQQQQQQQQQLGWSEREGLWSVLASAPEARASDLLLVSFDRALPLPERSCFVDALSPCPQLLRPRAPAASASADALAASPLSALPVAPPWLLVLAASMRWCNLEKVKIPQMAGLKALDDCFAATERAMDKGYATVDRAWHDASSDRCAVANVQRAVEGATPEADSKGGGKRKPLPYALAVAHLLRQKGGTNRKFKEALSKMEPRKLSDFATAHAGLIRNAKGGAC